jgi:hypothetical protein
LETLRAKFHTVKLPKSFLAVNLSEKALQGYMDASEEEEAAAAVAPETGEMVSSTAPAS